MHGMKKSENMMVISTDKVQSINRVHVIDKIARARITEVLEEKSLSLSGAIDKNSAVAIETFLLLHYVVVNISIKIETKSDLRL